MTDSQLLDRFVHQHDPQAFEQLVLRHQAMVAAVCARRLRDPADREDVMRETFLKLARQAAKIDHAVGPWLYRTANNTAIDLIRRQSTRIRHERAGGELHHDQQTETRAEPSLAEQAVLDDAIAELSDDDQTAIVGFYFEQRTQRDLAVQIGVNQSTVKRRIDAALEALRETLVRRGVVVSASALGTTLFTAQTSADVPASLTASIVQHACTTGQASTTFIGAIKMWIISHKFASSAITTMIVGTLSIGAYIAYADGDRSKNGQNHDASSDLIGVWLGTRDGAADDAITVVWDGQSMRFEGIAPPRWYDADLKRIDPGDDTTSFEIEITDASIQQLKGQSSSGLARLNDIGQMNLALAAPGSDQAPRDFTGQDGSRTYTLTRQPISDLIGEWEGTEMSDDEPVTMTVGHDSLRFHAGQSGEWYDASIDDIDFGADPMTLDVTISASSVKPLIGLGGLAIFKLESDTLIIAGLKPGSDRRPDHFEAKGGSRVFTFKRKPQTPPRSEPDHLL